MIIYMSGKNTQFNSSQSSAILVYYAMQCSGDFLLQ